MAEPVAIIRKNALEEVRVALDTFKGAELVDIRVFADFSGADSERRPTKKGVSLKVELLPELIAGLQTTLNEARARGWLSSTSGD